MTTIFNQNLYLKGREQGYHNPCENRFVTGRDLIVLQQFLIVSKFLLKDPE